MQRTPRRAVAVRVSPERAGPGGEISRGGLAAASSGGRPGAPRPAISAGAARSLDADPGDVRPYLVPTDPMDDAYRGFTHRLGLLPRGEVSKVMFAYLTLRQHNANLFLVGGPHPTSNRHVRVPVQKGPDLLGLLESSIGPVDEAIGVLQRARDAG